jgi:hypothetical protein
MNTNTELKTESKKLREICILEATLMLRPAEKGI